MTARTGIKLKAIATVLTLLTALAPTISYAQTTFASWTFESYTLQTPAAPGAGVALDAISPEVGTGSATAFHAGASIYSTPSGNGSAKSLSSNTWAVGDYYQFSTTISGVSTIYITWDQNGSSTGPRDFSLSYSANGSAYTGLRTLSLPGSVTWTAGAPNPTGSTTFTYQFDVSSFTSPTNVTFRLIDFTTTSINGGTVAVGGTDRVDNFSVTDFAPAVIPEPSTYASIFGGLALAVVAFRRRKS